MSACLSVMHERPVFPQEVTLVSPDPALDAERAVNSRDRQVVHICRKQGAAGQQQQQAVSSISMNRTIAAAADGHHQAGAPGEHGPPCFRCAVPYVALPPPRALGTNLSTCLSSTSACAARLWDAEAAAAASVASSGILMGTVCTSSGPSKPNELRLSTPL